MSSTTANLLERYFDQPERLPDDVRARIQAAWGGAPVELYAMADLDDAMRFAPVWVAVGNGAAAIAAGNGGGPVRVLRRGDVREVREIPGLSCTTVLLAGDPAAPPLAVLRFTHRQRRAMGMVVFALKQKEPVAGVAAAPDKAYAEATVHAVREAQASVARHRLALVWRLLGYLKPYRREVAAGMTGASLLTLAGLVPPLLTGRLIDKVIRPFEDGVLSAGDATAMAWMTLGVLALVHLLREAFAWVRLRTMAVLGEAVARDLRTDLYAHLHRLSVGYFSSKQTGSIISRVSSDTDRIWDFIAFGVVEVSLSLLTLLGLAGMLIATDAQLGLLLVSPLPFLMFFIYAHGRGMRHMFLRAWRKWSNLTDVLSDTIPGIRVVKAFDQAAHEKERFGRRNRTVTDEFFRIHRSWTGFWPLLMLGVHSLTLLVWFVAIPRLLGTEARPPDLTTGKFVAFLLYMGMVFYPIEVFGQMSRMLNRALSSAHRIFEVLDTEPQIIDVPEPVRLEPVRGHIRFEDVSFGYDPVRLVLRGVSFEVQPGEMIGLVGPSGAGKTTVINLLARFYDATGGRILVDGVDLRQLDLGHYRRQVGMVLQDPFLFHGSILDNIRYGKPDATLGDVIAASRAANAHDFICLLPHGYDTVVGERGHTLSGGERQRVSIARAVLHNPRILILDEATSSVDTETEHKIQEALNRLVAGRTVIAIAHRLSTLQRAARLIVLKEGRIAEHGTHAELLALPDGLYRKLHTLQQQLHEMYAV